MICRWCFVKCFNHIFISCFSWESKCNRRQRNRRQHIKFNRASRSDRNAGQYDVIIWREERHALTNGARSHSRINIWRSVHVFHVCTSRKMALRRVGQKTLSENRLSCERNVQLKKKSVQTTKKTNLTKFRDLSVPVSPLSFHSWKLEDLNSTALNYILGVTTLG